MNNADIGWMLVATALVLLMTPALGFFYGGMVRSKNALNTMMMSFVALGPVAVAWALLGYSLAFAPGIPVVGSLAFAGLRGVGLEAQGAIPHLLFMAFQGTFAIITAALISGAVVERLRFSAYLAFIVAVGARRLRAGGALGLGRRVSRHRGRARFCRRRRRARERGGGGAGGGARRRAAQGLRTARDAAAQRALHAARRRAALVRLVRVQRRQRPGGEPDGRAGVCEHAVRARRDAGDLDADRPRARRTASRPSAARRPSSSVSSWSRPRPATSGRPRRSRWAPSARCRATSR